MASLCTPAWMSPWSIRLCSLTDAVLQCHQNGSCWCHPLKAELKVPGSSRKDYDLIVWCVVFYYNKWYCWNIDEPWGLLFCLLVSSSARRYRMQTSSFVTAKEISQLSVPALQTVFSTSAPGGTCRSKVNFCFFFIFKWTVVFSLLQLYITCNGYTVNHHEIRIV